MYLRHFEKNVLYRKLRNTAASQTVCYAKLHLAVLKAHSALWALSRLFSMQLEMTMEAEVTTGFGRSEVLFPSGPSHSSQSFDHVIHVST